VEAALEASPAPGGKAVANVHNEGAPERLSHNSLVIYPDFISGPTLRGKDGSQAKVCAAPA
jgi:hypothetical protein